jgi:hypothetical protein
MANWIWTHVALFIEPEQVDAVVRGLLDVLGNEAGWKRGRKKLWSAPGESPRSATDLVLRLFDERLGWSGPGTSGGRLQIDTCEHTHPESELEEALLHRLAPHLVDGSEVLYEPNAEQGESGFRVRRGELVHVESVTLELKELERTRALVDELVRMFSRNGRWTRPADRSGREVVALLKRFEVSPPPCQARVCE